MTESSESSAHLKIAGTWQTKSGGELSVLFNFDNQQLADLMSRAGDLKGLRAYRVSGLKRGAIGANEWHKQRTELAFVTRGLAKWTLHSKDEADIIITSGPLSEGVLIRPGVLHTYEALENDTELLVIANTFFNPNDKTTHDTYTAENIR